MRRSVSRRLFLKSSAIGAAAIVPAGLTRAYAANEKINVAMIGAMGIARANYGPIQQAGGNIVALCDVDKGSLEKAAQNHPNAATWRDYRKMLQGQKNIDAVMVNTPDHVHAHASMMAIRLGKHVATEKPMAHNVREVRALARAAKEYGVVTQMDNEGHSRVPIRETVEWIQSGVIGDVTEAHIWTNRPIWPQAITKRPDPAPVPKDLDWDLWLGPAAYREYHEGLHPFKWRGWWDFGTGALGDMGCHFFDVAVWSLKLRHPTSVEAIQEGNNEQTGPAWSIVTYQFPARDNLKPVTLKWYSGGKKPEEAAGGERLGSNGAIFVGTKGSILARDGFGPPKWIGEEPQGFQPPEPFLPRVDGDHKADWFRAIRSNGSAGCDFTGHGGRLAEIVLLGIVPIRSGRRIDWDAANMRIPNAPEAEQYLTREYRKGWEL